ncbi:hypothetical protein QQ045_023472 [Rhodiola kirilowii]
MADFDRANFPIKTVVVLVQENRSFDHMLGWMKSLNPEINGVTGSESNPISASDPNSRHLLYQDNAAHVVADPGHSIQAIYEQVFGVPWTTDPPNPNPPTIPNMEGFVQQAEKTSKGLSDVVMNGFKPEAVPVYKELVKEFGVCDRWFASVPASTQPNRLYVHSATSYGATSNDTKKLIKGFPQKTIFQSLEESGNTFGIYYEYPPATLFYRNLRKLKYLDNFHQYELHFKKHCKEGKLPNYTVVEQRYFDLKILPGNDDHPSHDVAEGQKFIKEVYETLRASPQWNEMLFIIIYDEHGGFYDHVQTPYQGIPNPDGIIGPAPFHFNFDRLGVRVPCLMISPWIKPGTVLHGPSGPFPTSEFEHSSIPATVKKIFNLKSFLTKRDEWAGTFEGVINCTSPRTDCPVTLPDPIKMRDLEANENEQITEFQQELVQMAAALCGDHAKETYPDKLVEDMKVCEAVDYVNKAFNKFCEDCKHKNNHHDEPEESSSSNNNNVAAADVEGEPLDLDPSQQHPKAPASFFKKLFSCLVCNN